MACIAKLFGYNYAIAPVEDGATTPADVLQFPDNSDGDVYDFKKGLYTALGNEIMARVEKIVAIDLVLFPYCLPDTDTDTDFDMFSSLFDDGLTDLSDDDRDTDMDNNVSDDEEVDGRPVYILTKRDLLTRGDRAWTRPIITDDITQLLHMGASRIYVEGDNGRDVPLYEASLPRRFDRPLYQMNYDEFLYCTAMLEDTMRNEDFNFSRSYGHYLDSMYDAYVQPGYDVVTNYIKQSEIESWGGKNTAIRTLALIRFFHDTDRFNNYRFLHIEPFVSDSPGDYEMLDITDDDVLTIISDDESVITISPDDDSEDIDWFLSEGPFFEF